ncbi:MAG: patatin-like phospholipase family protein [Rickettsiales bacterium]|nr:patatin-like phospholipase family protein [Rickettsiales bacterium]
MKKSNTPKDMKIIDLALQGGGAHGSFTWGVLDALMEQEDLGIEAITATSAGAVNAAAFVSGYAKGGPEGAKQAMHDLWLKLSSASALLPWQETPFDRLFKNDGLHCSPTFMALDFITRMWSPYQTNVFDFNPLREVVEEVVDFEAVRQCNSIKLFVNATHVKTGKGRVFQPHEITLDVIMASACLPFLFKAVEVEGEAYWDGGYTGNPALYPLFYQTKSEDVLIVQINPVRVDEVPKEASEILDRVNDISFNASLMPEIRAVTFVKKLIEQGKLPRDQYKNVNLHLIETQQLMAHLGRSSKLNPDWDFINHLRAAGNQMAKDWLRDNYQYVGVRSSIDVENIYL